MSNLTLTRSVLDDTLNGNGYAGHVAARLLDFSADTTPWQRRLWDVGSLLALHEVVEAGHWVEQKVISTASAGWLRRSLEPVVGRDPGLGGSKLHQELTTLLRSDLSCFSRERRALRELITLIDASAYVDRWAVAVDTDTPRFGAERLARAVAAHLLDRGYSLGFVHRTVNAAVMACGTLRELLSTLAVLAGATPSRYEVLVPFIAVPRAQSLAAPLRQWRTSSEVASWMSKHASGAFPRQAGGFVYEVEALDVHAAARAAGAIVERLLARAGFARDSQPLVPHGRVWVAGHGEPLPLHRPSRGVHVLSLVGKGTMYRVDAPSRLDEALELAGPLDTGPTVPAVSGGWAAMESLLYQPGDPRDVAEGRVVAADRLAALVTCSWPRAELTALSYRYGRHAAGPEDALVSRLRACASSRERAAEVADVLATGVPFALTAGTDVAALARMRALVANPAAILRDVRETVQRCARRLYRQRNIVLHGGDTQAVALLAALRTAAPLVGVALDRLTHAYLTAQVEPLDLASRAELSLALAGSTDQRPLTDLLE